MRRFANNEKKKGREAKGIEGKRREERRGEEKRGEERRREEKRREEKQRRKEQGQQKRQNQHQEQQQEMSELSSFVDSVSLPNLCVRLGPQPSNDMPQLCPIFCFWEYLNPGRLSHSILHLERCVSLCNGQEKKQKYEETQKLDRFDRFDMF